MLLAIVALILLGVWLLLAQDVLRPRRARRHPAAGYGGRTRHQTAALHDRHRHARRRQWRRWAARCLLRSPSCIRRWAPEIITVAFVVVVIGGLGSFWGVVLAALLVGVVRGITIHFVPAAGEASIYVLMFLVLLFRPRGLLGERIEKFE